MKATYITRREREIRERKRFLRAAFGVCFAAGILVGTIGGVAIGRSLRTASSESSSQLLRGSAADTLLAPIPRELLKSDESDCAEARYISLGEFKLTAYCPCEKCCGIWAQNRPTDEAGNEIIRTASGKIAEQGYTVAADKAKLPFGTKLMIDGHEYEVQDVGGAIKDNRIDVYFESHEEALAFGVQYAEVFALQETEG